MFWESLDPCLEGNDVTQYGTEEIFVSTEAAIFSDLRHPKTEGQDPEEWAVRRLVSVLPVEDKPLKAKPGDADIISIIMDKAWLHFQNTVNEDWRVESEDKIYSKC